MAKSFANSLTTPSGVEALYSQFQVYTATYKVVRSHCIEVDVIIPSSLLGSGGTPRSPRPIIVKFHGGALITGSKSFLPWFGPWVLELALSHRAIIVAPNYRLLPEASGLDVLSDQEDFFHWLRNSLPDFLAQQTLTQSGIFADLNRILVTGDSAGAYLTILAAMHQPTHQIRAAIAAYPSLDLRCEEFNNAEAAQRNPSFGAPILPEDTLQDHINGLGGDEVVSDSSPPARMELLLCASQQGKLTDLYGHDTILDPVRLLENLSLVGKDGAQDLPHIAVWHGTKDSAIPFQGSIDFVQKVNEMTPRKPAIIHLEAGAEHGFDNDREVVNTNMPWVREILDAIEPTWLA